MDTERAGGIDTIFVVRKKKKKSRIRETLNISTDADSINIAMKKKTKYIDRVAPLVSNSPMLTLPLRESDLFGSSHFLLP